MYLRFGAVMLVPLQRAAGCFRVLLERGVLGWHRSRALLLCNLGAGAVAGGRCEMSMAECGVGS